MEEKQLQLYIHIPFCKQKCTYCDFLSFASIETEQTQYVDVLLQEIESYREIAQSYTVSTIFIGGGTPSIIDQKQMQRIMNQIRCIFVIAEDAEISMEINPGTVNLEKLQAYAKMGINRISIGLQAIHDEELQLLGRVHNYQRFLETFHAAREVGICNINVDLITAIPKQTVESWIETLDTIIALQPEHISAYSLIIEEGTKLYQEIAMYEKLLPSEEAEREMYHITKEKLEEAGYHRYETSNYAKVGYACHHNLGYWARQNYLGIGLGAASLLENQRFSNQRDMQSYRQAIQQYQETADCYKMWEVLRVEQETLTQVAQMEEFMFLGLRKIEGVSKAIFAETFGVSMEEIYAKPLGELTQKQLIENTKDIVKLTDLGIDVSNYVLAEFLL